jgi:hypothetical protein
MYGHNFNTLNAYLMKFTSLGAYKILSKHLSTMSSEF